jgi:very-short-patch-repair endonuclease
VSDLEDALAWQLKAAGVPDPVRELVFAKSVGRKWRFDFAWLDRKVALEVEGGTWVNGAHNRGAHFESDAEKYNTGLLMGWLVLRVTAEMVTDGRALAFVERALARKPDRP